MVNYREILRLKSLKYSQREIALSVHSSRNTVKEVVDLATALKIEWPLDPDVTNQELESVLYPGRKGQNTDRMPIDFPRIHRELAKKGVTLSLLWTEYCAEANAAGRYPYMSTQFGDLYRKWAKVSKATMRISRKPGETFEVDWAGATVDIHDSVTGEISPAYLFVGVLSCSSFVYAELCRDMKSENFILCHVHAYEYFGGVTRLLVPDNLKAGVTKNTRYETSIPRAYQEMADYYDTAIVPARPKAPDDKPNAEASVKFATTWILAAVRNQRFFSFEEARDTVAEKLELLNDRPFKARKGCRRSAYEEEEREFMHPLPPAPYEPATWRSAKVQNDYTITDGLNRYSVPFDLIGECVDIRLTRDTVETVVLLTRKRKSKDYKVEIEIPIDVDGSKTYTEEKSTYQNIKKFIKAKYGVNTHTKDIAEVKRDCGVEMRLNYNISKKENPKIRHCTQEKRGYIMDALEYYQVI